MSFLYISKILVTKIKNKIIWITGSSSGIGEALAIKCSELGAKVILSSRRNSELERVAKKCKNETLLINLDLNKQDEFRDKTQKIISHFGNIDILINNAGLSQRSLADETSIEIDRKIMEINYFGTIALTKTVLPFMEKQKSGHIVTISSLSGKFGFYLRSAYSASKFALIGFFESLRLEQEKNKIKVSLVFPGFINTNISKNALQSNGEASNEMDNNQAKGISAEKCASDIILGIHKNKHQIVSGGKEKWSILFNRLFPRKFYNILKKQNPK